MLSSELFFFGLFKNLQKKGIVGINLDIRLGYITSKCFSKSQYVPFNSTFT